MIATEVMPEAGRKMGRKKSDQKTTMIRVTEAFAELVGNGAAERRLSVADYCEKYLVPCAEKAHREYIKAEWKKLSGEDK